MKKILIIIAVALALASCSKTEYFGPADQPEETYTYTLPVQLNDGAGTKAASVTIPSGHQLRYVLQLFDVTTATAQGNLSNLVNTQTQYTTGSSAVTFSLTMIKGRTYHVSVWADFVTGATAGLETDANKSIRDTYYDTDVASAGTTNLDAVVINRANYTASSTFDAYSANQDLGATPTTIELRRPLSKFTYIASDWSSATQTLMGTPLSVRVTYSINASGNTNTRFSVLGGSTTNSGGNIAYVYNITAPATGTNWTIAEDFLFGRASQSIQDVTFQFYSATNAGGNLLATATFLETNSNGIPYRRNYHTTVTASMFSLIQDWSFEVNDIFDGTL